MKIIAPNARMLFTWVADVVRCLQEHRNKQGRNQMWIKTFRTEEMRQHLEGEFPMHLAVEQRFPSHPNGKITFRAYKTNIDSVCIEGENYLDLRAKIVNRKI